MSTENSTRIWHFSLEKHKEYLYRSTDFKYLSIYNLFFDLQSK